MKRKVMVLGMVVLLMCAIVFLPYAVAIASDEFQTQTSRSGSITLVKYNGSGVNVVIPDGIKIIGPEAFKNCDTVTSIVIPDTVTYMEDNAFSWCSSLASITLPDSITNISKGAFYECRSLKSVSIGKSVTKIGSSAFMYCVSLTNVVIPDGVTEIGVNAFYKCDLLRDVVIGNGVTKIETRAFCDCPSLRNVTLGRSVESIGSSAFKNDGNKLTIYGESGTFAQQYAEANHLKFVDINAPAVTESAFPSPTLNITFAHNPNVTVTKAVSPLYDYSPDQYAIYSSVPYLQTVVGPDGEICVLHTVADAGNKIYIYEYSPDMKFKRTLSFSREMEKVGAFTKDDKGNYYIFYAKSLSDNEIGQINMLLVKYSALGVKVGEVRFGSDVDGTPAGVKVPFYAGNCRMEISGDVLAAYFARMMFNGHQASFGFYVDLNTFKEIRSVGEGRSMTLPYVSHSFNQFVLPTSRGFAFVDHGDAYPRGFSFSDVERRVYGNGRINSFEFFNFDPSFASPSLYNQTFAEMGGLARTDDGYIFVGTYDNNKPGDGKRNLFLLTVDDSLDGISSPIWLTKYTAHDAVSPKIVRVDGDRYLLMWRANRKTYVAFVDGNGKLMERGVEVPGVLVNAYDVLRYNEVTGFVHWATDNGDGSFSVYGFNPDAAIR